jgi:uncharacterized lipoprotein
VNEVHLPAYLRPVLVGLLACVVVLLAACSRKSETAPEKAIAKSEAGSPSALDPKATIDHMQKRLDEAAAKAAQRREQMEAQTK